MTEKDLEEQIDVDDSQDVEEVKKEDVESESEEEMNEKENEEDELLWFAVKNADEQRAEKEKKVRKFTQNLIEQTPKRIEMKQEEDLEL